MVPYDMVPALENIAHVSQYCPCSGTTMTIPDTDGEEAIVCGSQVEFDDLLFHEYCQSMVESTRMDELYEEAKFAEDLYEYWQALRELNGTQVLTDAEVDFEAQAALTDLREDLIDCQGAGCPPNSCLAGCVVFIRDVCCSRGEYNGVYESISGGTN